MKLNKLEEKIKFDQIEGLISKPTNEEEASIHGFNDDALIVVSKCCSHLRCVSISHR